MTTATRNSRGSVTVSAPSRAMQQAAAAAESAMETSSSAADDVKARIEAQLQSSLEAALTAPREQIAEPLYWWEIFGYGPVQIPNQLVPPAGFLDSPLAPGKILRVGEKGYLVSVFIVNPFPLPQDPNIRPVDFLTVWKLPYRIDYHTCNATTCRPAGPELNVTHYGNLIPGQAYYVDVLEFTAYEPGCVYETNICARILDCESGHPGYGHSHGKSPSPFAGFARSTFNLDPELFLPTQTLEFDNPIRFMVYE
jgi:hypothetical protein